MSELEHGLEAGDRLRSERRESDLIVQAVRDTVVDFGGDVGQRTHREIASGLRTGQLERIDEEGPEA
jgi:hypothetical protein